MASSRVFAYRMVSPRWESSAFSGEGARKFGGRWNPVGYPVVYLGGSRALTALEMLVHLTTPGSRGKGYRLLEVSLPSGCVERVDVNALGAGWGSEPPTSVSLRVGKKWLDEGRSLALEVPSVLVPEEFNVLVNPLHADFGKLVVGDGRDFGFDVRL